MTETVLMTKTARNRGPAPTGDSCTLVVDSFRWRIVARPNIWQPPTDVYDLDDALVVRVEIAGVRQDDLQISIDRRYLSIRGIRQDASERRAYHQMEILFGEFGVQVELPFPVISDQIQACYRDGFLKVILPKNKE